MTSDRAAKQAHSPPIKVLGIALGISAISGWISLFFLLRAPSDAEAAFFLGYSLERLFLVGIALLPSLGFSLLVFRTRRDTSLLAELSAQLEKFLSGSLSFTFLWVASVIILVLSWVLVFLAAERATALLGSISLYLLRLRPVLWYAIAMSISLLVAAFSHHFDLDTRNWAKARPTFRLAIVLFIAFVLLWVLIAVTGFGLGFDVTEWNAPGAPVLSGQVFLVVMLALGTSALLYYWRGNLKERWVDVGLFLLIWGTAAIFWLSISAAPNHYISPSLPPNAESYPLSDAFNHDVIANNALIGEGFRFNDLRAVRKPLYAAFLAGLHSLTGSDYGAMIEGQVMVLALFPALLFVLAKSMHSRLAGLVLAGIVTLREANSIYLGDLINLSHAKMLMADFPAALGLAFLAVLAIRFLRGEPSRRNALLLGAVLGFLLLLRSQQLTLIPVLLLLFYLVFRSSQISAAKTWQLLFLFVFGIGLAAGPWLLRNRAFTGQWVIEHSIVASFLAQRYSDDPQSVEGSFLPGESEGEYYARHMSMVVSAIQNDPLRKGTVIADNYMRNLYLSVMPLPLSLQVRGLEGHVRELPYWPSWDGGLLPESILPLGASLFLVAVGISAAWKRLGWVGLIPLAINVGFAVNLAIARVSGWRYNQPVDWILILYYALGIAQLILCLFALIRKSEWLDTENRAQESVADGDRQDVSWRRLGFGAAFVLLLGSSPILWEQYSSPRFQALSRDEGIALLQDAAIMGEDSQFIEGLLSTRQLGLVAGRALYPRFLASGQGNAQSEFALTVVEDFSRISFFLIGPEPGSVFLPIDESPADFQSGADVLVFFCANQRSRAAAVLLTDDQNRATRLLVSNTSSPCAD